MLSESINITTKIIVEFWPRWFLSSVIVNSCNCQSITITLRVYAVEVSSRKRKLWGVGLGGVCVGAFLTRTTAGVEVGKEEQMRSCIKCDLGMVRARGSIISQHSEWFCGFWGVFWFVLISVYSEPCFKCTDFLRKLAKLAMFFQTSKKWINKLKDLRISYSSDFSVSSSKAWSKISKLQIQCHHWILLSGKWVEVCPVSTHRCLGH